MLIIIAAIVFIGVVSYFIFKPSKPTKTPGGPVTDQTTPEKPNEKV